MSVKKVNDLITKVNELYDIRSQLQFVDREIMKLIGYSDTTPLSFFSNDDGTFTLTNYENNENPMGEYECTPENIDKALSCTTYGEFKAFMDSIEINKSDVPRGFYIDVKDIEKMKDDTPEYYKKAFEGK